MYATYRLVSLYFEVEFDFFEVIAKNFNCLQFFTFSFVFFHSIDDILADSDSDLSGEDEKENTKKSKNPQTYIRETEDSIVDLADSNAFSRITSEFKTR